MISFLFLNTWSQIPFSSSCMHFQSHLFFCRIVAHLILCIGLYSTDAVVLIVGYRWPRNDWFEMICFRNNKSKGFHPKYWILICRSYLGRFQNIFKNFETLYFVLKATSLQVRDLQSFKTLLEGSRSFIFCLQRFKFLNRKS